MFKPTRISGAALGVLVLTLAGATRPPFNKTQKAFYADPKLVAFVRPGLLIKIVSAEITPDGVISVNFALTDPAGVPLDRSGVSTPGAISLNFIAAYIPKDQT